MAPKNVAANEEEVTTGTITTEPDNTQAPADSAQPATEGAKQNAGDNRFVVLKVPAEDGSVETIKRADYIRREFQRVGGPFYGDRGALAKRLTELEGRKVPYQIVFAATRDLKHIRKPEAAAATTPAEGATAEAGEGGGATIA